ncbi:hypothetical protein KNY73_001971 [Salmonella enterica subsp. enterica serovar Javiana]|nr:hypothetical protein [Salmonella enterica subsp. enterica serovar Javiana]EHQ1586882.1 hypothetical protein [Salmonella enterica]
MSDIKRYEITWVRCSMHGVLIVEIDPDICDLSQVIGLYEFCGISARNFPLREEEDLKFDLVTIMLKVLAQRCFTLMIGNNWGLRQLLRHFEDNGHYLSGDSGIKIIDIPFIPLYSNYMKVKEVS